MNKKKKDIFNRINKITDDFIDLLDKEFNSNDLSELIILLAHGKIKIKKYL